MYKNEFWENNFLEWANLTCRKQNFSSLELMFQSYIMTIWVQKNIIFVI